MPISSTVSAIFLGSSASSHPLGLPVLTEQNWHALVQVSPITINVAVPLDQHSERFGHLASSQTVLNCRLLTLDFINSKFLFA